MANPTKPLLIGLLGGVGSGKSTVAKLLSGLGASVFDADRVANDLLTDDAVRAELTRAFGQTILSPQGAVDRPSLARLVFASPPARERINAIIHPRVMARLREWLRSAAEQEPGRPLVLDVPLLLETELRDLAQVMIFVDAPDAARRERVQAHRGWAEGELERRERAQAALSEKLERADHVIVNDGTLRDLERRVTALWQMLPVHGRKS